MAIFETDTWKRRTALPGNGKRPWDLAFSPDSRILATGSTDAIYLWSTTDFRRLRTIPIATDEGNFAFSADGETLYITTAISANAYACNVRTGEMTTSISRFKAISPDGRWEAAIPLHARLSADRLMLIDLDTRQEKWRIRPHIESFTAVFSSDSRTLATTSKDGTMRWWNTACGQPMFTFRAPSYIWNHAVAYSNNGRWLALGCGSGEGETLFLFCAATPEEVASGRSLGPPPRVLGAATNRVATPKSVSKRKATKPPGDGPD